MVCSKCCPNTDNNAARTMKKGLRRFAGKGALRNHESARPRPPAPNAPMRFCTSAGTRYTRTISRWSRRPHASRWTTKHRSASLAARTNCNSRRDPFARGRNLTERRAPPPTLERFRSRARFRAACLNEAAVGARLCGHDWEHSSSEGPHHPCDRCHVASVMPAAASRSRCGPGCRPWRASTSSPVMSGPTPGKSGRPCGMTARLARVRWNAS